MKLSTKNQTCGAWEMLGEEIEEMCECVCVVVEGNANCGQNNIRKLADFRDVFNQKNPYFSTF